MADLPEIRYQHGSGPVLTPASPCMFSNHCSPTDAAAWVYLARKWTDAAAEAAATQPQRFEVSRLRAYVAQLAEGVDECNPAFDPTGLEVFDCEPYVRGLVGATERARMLVIAWGATPPHIPGPWEPTEGWSSVLLGEGGAIWKLLPWAMLAWMANDAFRDRR